MNCHSNIESNMTILRLIRDLIIILWVILGLLYIYVDITNKNIIIAEEKKQTDYLQSIQWQLYDMNALFNRGLEINN